MEEQRDEKLWQIAKRLCGNLLACEAYQSKMNRVRIIVSVSALMPADATELCLFMVFRKAATKLFFSGLCFSRLASVNNFL